MEVLSSIDRENGKEYNALNDRRRNGSITVNINSDTHLMFEWDEDARMWVFKPHRIYANTTMPIDNDHILIRISSPERESKHFVPQPTLRDMKNTVFANRILKALEFMDACPPPAWWNKKH